MNLSTQLTEIGFTPDEAEVYLALLELGGAPASTVARKTGINRVNCYYILSTLKKRGLVSEIDQNKIKFYSCASPNTLIKKEEAVLEKINNLLPELYSLQNSLAVKPRIRYFEGKEGIEQIYEDTLQNNEEIVGYSNLELIMETLDTYMKRYARKKLSKKTKSRIIAPGNEISKKFLSHYYKEDPHREITEILFVSPRSFAFENDIYIYGNKLAIISLKSEELFGMILESASVAKTQKSLFNLAWLGATSFVAMQ